MMERAAIWPSGLAALLGIIALAEIFAPADVAPPIAAPRETTAAAVSQADVSSLAAAWSATILARPIFRPDRRPLEAAPAAPTAMPRLTAIVITAAGAAAIFVGDDGTAVAVRKGGLVDGQLVRSITAGAVTLAGPTGITILRPQFGAAPSAAPNADAQAPAAGVPASGFPASPPAPLAGIPNNVDRF
jgi:general secretion pathway protein N